MHMKVLITYTLYIFINHFIFYSSLFIGFVNTFSMTPSYNFNNINSSNNLMSYNDYALYPYPLSSGHNQNESREPLSMQNDSSWSYYPPNHQFSELAQQNNQTNVPTNIQQQSTQQQNYSTDSPIISQYPNQQQQQQQQSSHLPPSTTSTIKQQPPISTTSTTTVDESNPHRITTSSTRRTAESEVNNNNTIEKPQRIKRKISWSSEQLSYAFNLIKQGKTAREAARIAEIPHSTLHDRIRNPHKHPRPGKPTVLSQSEEILIVNYLVNLMDSGYNVNNNTLKNIVHEIIRNDGRTHPFKEDGPHRHWFGGFEKRHPILLEYKKKHKYNCNNNKNMIKSEVTMDMIDIFVKDINHYNINGNIDQIAQDIENSMNRDETEDDENENEENNIINNNNTVQQLPPPPPPPLLSSPSSNNNIILQESTSNNIEMSNNPSIDNNFIQSQSQQQSLTLSNQPQQPPPPSPPLLLQTNNKQSSTTSSTKCKREWNVNDIELAIKQMQNGVSIRVVSTETGIPTGTIRNHIRNPNMCCKRGPPTVLHDYEEKLIEKYLIKYCSDNNIIIYKWNNDDVCKIVKRLLKNDSRENVFKNDGPHRHWYQVYIYIIIYIKIIGIFKTSSLFREL